MRYDNGNLAVIRDLGELELYVEQNSSRRIQRKREIRMALRALEGQTVQWPYKHITVSSLETCEMSFFFLISDFSLSVPNSSVAVSGRNTMPTQLFTMRLACSKLNAMDIFSGTRLN